MDRVAIHEAIASTWKLVDELNNYITTQEPWVLAKEESTRERLGTVLYTSIEGLRVLAVLLAPVMPKACEKLWAAIGSSLGGLSSQSIGDAGKWGQLKAGVKISELEALFPRVEEK